MSKGKFALGALFGAVVGLTAGLLTAPKSGKETRADIKAKAKDIEIDVAKKTKTVVSEASKFAEDAKVKAQDFTKDAKIEVTDIRDRTERAVEGAKQGFFSKK